jgi:SAM-dependent methyltransferase
MRTLSQLRPWQLPPYPGESEAELHDRQDRAYFEEQIEDTADWWQRMGGDIDLTGLSVLDFGCGHGALCVGACERGAAQVTGIDLDRRRIAFARRYLPARYPQWRDRLRLLDIDVANLEEDGCYDVILSKDCFEHVEDLPATIGHLHRLLRPGGKLLVGFSPLFHSPFGDHGRLWPRLPWLPALLPERFVLAMASRRQGRRLRSMADVGLNKLTPAGFRAALSPPQWHFERLEYNRSDRLMMPVMNVLRRVPALERWFTVGIYATVIRL